MNAPAARDQGMAVEHRHPPTIADGNAVIEVIVSTHDFLPCALRRILKNQAATHVAGRGDVKPHDWVATLGVTKCGRKASCPAPCLAIGGPHSG